MKSKIVHNALFGLAVGDALGVPVEFKSRAYLTQNPVEDMKGYGTHNQPTGTWSDDSSLTFCLAESLSYGYDLQDISQKFLKWYNGNIWTPHGEVFDIGIATGKAIREIAKGVDPVLCGGSGETDNGNGSLMRILPLLFYLQGKNDLQYIFQLVKEVSSITHAHFRSVFACFIYIIYGVELLEGNDKDQAYHNMKFKLKDFIAQNNFESKEINLFNRILIDDISTVTENEIYCSGYVLHSLEASLWCILTTKSYEDAVLKAVNLGDDTDTTAAIAGGLAGLVYGFEAIPEKWISMLVRKGDIENLCNKLQSKYEQMQSYTIAKLVSNTKNKSIFSFGGIRFQKMVFFLKLA